MLKDIIQERRNKVDRLRKEGINPYPASCKRTHTAHEALKSFAALKRAKKNIFLVGRIRSLRIQGNIGFVSLEDASGKIQVVLKKDNLKEYKLYTKTLDIGDFVQVNGTLFTTKRGEKSVEAKGIKMLNKTLRPLPSDFYGLEDMEIRLRKRYLDALLNPDTKELFVKKSLFWKSIREFLNKEEFLEVDTPVLEEIPGGAEAEPFVTHHNALDEDFYLRISLEIALKKMMVGGYEKIYEIGKVFRNEGIDAEHLQDYTQMEFYWAYADYTDLMKMLEKMYKYVIKKTFGTTTLTHQGKKIDWGKKWRKIDYAAEFKKKNKLDISTCSKQALIARAKELKIKVEKSYGKGRLIDLIYKKTIRPAIIQPTFLINHPVIISPLAKRDPDDLSKTQRLQIVACGSELGNAFSELNDPQDQRARFEEQMELRKAGDKEAQILDEEFLEALEYGMPPAAGFGLSERLFAVLADKPIREIVFFPPMKRKNNEK